MKWSDTAWAWFSIFLENPLVQVGRHLLALRHATSLRRGILIANSKLSHYPDRHGL
jgi:hypothetical protein